MVRSRPSGSTSSSTPGEVGLNSDAKSGSCALKVNGIV